MRKIAKDKLLKDCRSQIDAVMLSSIEDQQKLEKLVMLRKSFTSQFKEIFPKQYEEALDTAFREIPQLKQRVKNSVESTEEKAQEDISKISDIFGDDDQARLNDLDLMDGSDYFTNQSGVVDPDDEDED